MINANRRTWHEPTVFRHCNPLSTSAFWSKIHENRDECLIMKCSSKRPWTTAAGIWWHLQALKKLLQYHLLVKLIAPNSSGVDAGTDGLLMVVERREGWIFLWLQYICEVVGLQVSQQSNSNNIERRVVHLFQWSEQIGQDYRTKCSLGLSLFFLFTLDCTER